MTVTQQHLAFEKFSRQLIGLTVLKVEYSEIMYEQTNPTPYYPTKFKNLDSVDFSIFLHTEKDKLIEIYWDDKFFQFGIGIKINEPSDFSGSIKWDVSTNDLWKKFIETTIIDIHINWDTVTAKEERTSKTEKFVYPQDVKISFSNNENIFISAAGFLNQSDKEVYGMLDNLMVTDNLEIARKIKMIREISVCDECESEFFKESSQMISLCPNCAHSLYGYPNCKHEFINENCLYCGWNGNSSDYIQNSKK